MLTKIGWWISAVSVALVNVVAAAVTIQTAKQSKTVMTEL